MLALVGFSPLGRGMYSTSSMRVRDVGGFAWSESTSYPVAVNQPGGLACPSAMTCMAVGTNTNGNLVVLGTTDGGSTWTNRAVPGGTLALRGISCASATTCEAVGEGQDGKAVLAGTADGGTTWTSQTVPAGPTLLDGISCALATTCEAVGSNSSLTTAFVLGTTDGGTTWTSQTVPAGVPSLGSVSCASATTCEAIAGGSGAIGHVFGTTDGGSTWTSQPVPPGVIDMGAISCASVTTCEAMGLNDSFLAAAIGTTDGGTTWQRQSLPFGVGTFSSISCASASTCLAVGSSIVTSTGGGATWSLQSVPAAVALFSSVSCASTSDCEAVGSTSTDTMVVDGTTDGGTTWTSQPVPPGVMGGEAISCASASTCVALGSDDSSEPVIISTRNGGATWVKQVLPGGVRTLSGVSCASTTTCVAVGSNLWGAGSIIRTANGGTTWEHDYVPSGVVSLSGISCASTTTCEAVGFNGNGAGIPVGTTDGGLAWKIQILPTFVALLPAISCASATTCEAVATAYTSTGSAVGHIFGTTDGGNTWTDQTIPPGVLTLDGISCPSTASCFAAGSGTGSTGGLVLTYGPTTPPQGGSYSALSPVRICDTRTGNPSELSGVAAQCLGKTIKAGTTLNVAAAGSFAVPQDVLAVAINVTAIKPATNGYLTVYPTGEGRPTSSNLNVRAGAVVANLVQVAVGSGGEISIFSSTTTDVAIDLQGYFSTSPTGGAGAGLYDALSSPIRVCDTRAGNPSVLTGAAGQCNDAPVVAGGHVTVAIAGSFGIPRDASAIVANVTAISAAAQGFLAVYPDGAAPPTVSDVNFGPGETVPNLVTATLGADGKIDVLSSRPSNVVVDVFGYYTAAGGTGAKFFTAAAPTRICDTRAGNPSGLFGAATQCNGTSDAGEALGPAGTLTVDVGGQFSVPAGATAVVVSVTGIEPTRDTFLTIFPGTARPTTSDLNPRVGAIEPNLVVAALSTRGSLSVYNASGSVNIAVDIEGWYQT